MDEVVHLFVSYVEVKLDDAEGNLKKREDIIRVRQQTFEKIMNDEQPQAIRTYGVDESFEIGESSPSLKAGSFKDPATLFRKK